MAGRKRRYTEAWWLRSIDYTSMIKFLGRRLSKRKRILFGCATARLVWDFVTQPCNRHAILTSEAFADGKATIADMRSAWQSITWEPAMYTEWHIVALTAGVNYKDPSEKDRAHCDAADSAPFEKTRLDWANALREIAGNPHQLVPINPLWLVANDQTVARLAASIYEDYSFDHLPILADALEDAGCNNEFILDHLRGPGPHYRGCWALDLCLKDLPSTTAKEYGAATR